MSRPALPGFALSASVLWLLTGALYKLFDGSPNDLPPSLVERSPFDMFDTFRYAILIELSVVGLVLTVPRLGWVLLAGTFATFLAILVPLAMEGADSCGCFGSTLTIKPWMMMLVDGALLLLLLFSKPWRLPKESGLGFAAFVPFLVLSIAAPMAKLERPKLPTVVKPVAGSTDVTDGQEQPPVDDGASDPTAEVDHPNAAGTEPEADITEPPLPVEVEQPTVEVVEPAEPELPEFYELRWQEWDGKDFYETDIASFADQSQGAVLPKSHVIVYRQTCEVCQKHLEQLWEEEQNNPEKWFETSLILIRIVENSDTPENNLCVTLPANHQMVTLPALKRGYGITTPMSFDVNENNVVENIIDVRELMDH